MFGGFVLAEISFGDVFAFGGAFNSGSVVVWTTSPLLMMPFVAEYNQ